MDRLTYNVFITGRPGSGKHSLKDSLESRTVSRGKNIFRFQGHLDAKDLPPIDFAVVLIKCSDEHDGFAQNPYIQNARDLTLPSRVCIVGTHRDSIVHDYGPVYLASRRHAPSAVFYHAAPYLPLNCLDGDDVQLLCQHIVDAVTASPREPTGLPYLLLKAFLFNLKNHMLDFVAKIFSLPVPVNINQDKPDDGKLDDQGVDHLVSSSFAESWRASLKARVKSIYPAQAMPTHQISPKVIVKRNAKHERDAIDYIRRNTRIPVPQIHHRNLQEWTAFEFIEGEMLLECLEKKSLFMQFRIACTLRCYLGQLRCLKGAVPGRLRSPGVVSGTLFDNSARGPFPSLLLLQGWCEMVAMRGWSDIVTTHLRSGEPRQIPPEPLIGRPWSLHYSHGDLNHGNIMLSKDGMLWLIDWAESGFYPSGYESAVMAYFEDGPQSWQRMRSFIAGGEEGDVMYSRFWSFFHSGIFRFLADHLYDDD